VAEIAEISRVLAYFVPNRRARHTHVRRSATNALDAGRRSAALDGLPA